MSVRLDLRRPVEDMALAERQLGEIVSAVAAGAKILLLDEPTSSLGPLEVSELIATIRRLAGGGTTIGLVTHRISEVMQGADHITVLRGGTIVLDDRVAGRESEAIARLMVGDRDRSAPSKTPVTSTWQRLEVQGIRLDGEAAPILNDVSFSVRQGEILGLAGVSGAMQPALARVIAGLVAPDSGTVRIDGADVTGNPRAAMLGGLAYVPEDRSQGLAPDLANFENASLLRMGEAGFKRLGLRNTAAERALGERILVRFNVQPPNPDLASGGLSGGNQQKLLVGRELEREPGVIVAHGPTQGLDLAASAAIRAALVEAAAKGAAIVVISADLDELLLLGHRMLVLAGGHITGEFDLGRAIDMTAVGRAMTGLSMQATLETTA